MQPVCKLSTKIPEGISKTFAKATAFSYRNQTIKLFGILRMFQMLKIFQMPKNVRSICFFNLKNPKDPF